MANTAKDLFNEISNTLKPNTRRPELDEFTTLKVYHTTKEVEFSQGWHTNIVVGFKPKTISVKITKIDSSTKDKTIVSKSYPLEQENLLDTILNLL